MISAREHSGVRAARSTHIRLGVTLGAGALAGLAVARVGLSLEGFIDAFLICVVAVLAVIDLEERRIPNRIVLPATGVVLAAQVIADPSRAPEFVVAALGAALFFSVPLAISRGGMGMGDVKMSLLLGAALGKGVVIAIAVAAFAVFPIALAMLLRGGTSARTQGIPFAPFLALGAAVAVFLS
jgi:prepilin signal peptidase PulO-like enzyme (type II secretory pathway)